jgi:hypothetical protein
MDPWSKIIEQEMFLTYSSEISMTYYTDRLWQIRLLCGSA